MGGLHDGRGSTATMQTDGNFVVRDARGVTLWSTQTSGAGSVVRVLGTANVAVYQRLRRHVGHHRRPRAAGWACYSRATQDCIQRFGYYGQRAWYYPVDAVGQQLHELLGLPPLPRRGEEPGQPRQRRHWDDNARAKGFAVDQSPRVGDIAQWNSNHVAYVDWVSADGNTSRSPRAATAARCSERRTPR